MGAGCTIVTVCRGGADVTLWMMRLEPPMEVMVGTVSTLTVRRAELVRSQGGTNGH